MSNVFTRIVLRSHCARGGVPLTRDVVYNVVPPLFLGPEQIWDIPASAKTAIGPEIVAATSCSLLLIDLDDWNSFRTAKRWHSSIMEGERVMDALTGLCAAVVKLLRLFQRALSIKVAALYSQYATPLFSLCFLARVSTSHTSHTSLYM